MYNFEELIFFLMGSSIVLGIAFLSYLLNALAYYRMAQKANVKNAWLAFIPFLQFIIFFHLIDRSAWNLLLFLVPLLNIVLVAVWHYRLFERFGAGGGVGLLVIILSFFTGVAIPIYLMYLGFSSQVQYQGTHRYTP